MPFQERERGKTYSVVHFDAEKLARQHGLIADQTWSAKTNDPTLGPVKSIAAQSVVVYGHACHAEGLRRAAEKVRAEFRASAGLPSLWRDALLTAIVSIDAEIAALTTKEPHR